MREFRELLSEVPRTEASKYADECLKNKFPIAA
jgi:hypothetical protein